MSERDRWDMVFDEEEIGDALNPEYETPCRFDDTGDCDGVLVAGGIVLDGEQMYVVVCEAHALDWARERREYEAERDEEPSKEEGADGGDDE